MVVFLCFTKETLPLLFYVNLHMATVTGDQLLMNTIHFEQEMETGLELFASFALRSILTALTHHNQHLNETECCPEHTVPKDSFNCAVGSERHAERCHHHDWVHSCARSLLF